MAAKTTPGCFWKTEDICNISTLATLAQDQQSGKGAVANIYKTVKQDYELLRETLKRGNIELRQLYKVRGSMRINSEGVLEVRYVENQREKWRVICPEISRDVVIWTTHRQAHSGISRTINRIKMTWYWPGMTADIRRVVRTCEICQMAKSGGSKDSGGKAEAIRQASLAKTSSRLGGPSARNP